VAELAFNARLWWRLIGARARSEWQYRASFFGLLIWMFVVTALDFVAIVLVFERVPLIGDWTIEQIAFLYGTGVTSAALADFLVGGIEKISDRIRLGTFDQVLTRPAPAMLQIVADEFALRRMGKILQSGVILGWSLAVVEVDWTIARVVAVPLMVITGTVVFIAIWIAANCISFWFTDTREASNSVTYGGSYLAQFPLGIYGRWFRNLFAVAVPISFVNYLPALFVLDRSDDTGLASWLRFASPAVAIIAMFAALQLWGLGIRHYRSTGS